MQNINLNQSFSTNTNTISRRNQNDTVIIMKTDDANVFYKIEGAGVHVWHLFQSPCRASDIKAALEKKFKEVSAAQIEADLTQFISKLTELGILITAPMLNEQNPDVISSVVDAVKEYKFLEVKAFDLAQIESEVLNESIYLDVFAGSDMRLKENVKTIENSLDKVKNLEGISFNWNSHAKAQSALAKEGVQIGLVAQQVAEVMPELVRKDEQTGVLAINYTKIIPYLVESIKELNSKLEAQQNKIDTLENQIKILKN